jgi:hypothetical protein
MDQIKKRSDHDNLGKKTFYQKGKMMRLNSHTLKDKIEKKKLSKPGLTHQTHDPSHKIGIM